MKRGRKALPDCLKRNQQILLSFTKYEIKDLNMCCGENRTEFLRSVILNEVDKLKKVILKKDLKTGDISDIDSIIYSEEL